MRGRSRVRKGNSAMVSVEGCAPGGSAISVAWVWAAPSSTRAHLITSCDPPRHSAGFADDRLPVAVLSNNSGTRRLSCGPVLLVARDSRATAAGSAGGQA